MSLLYVNANAVQGFAAITATPIALARCVFTQQRLLDPRPPSFRYHWGVEEFLIVAVGYLRLAVEAIGAAVIGIGAAGTVFRYVLSLLGMRKDTNSNLRLYLGRFLALGLEFQLASDILATAVAPTFEEVQLLAAIVVIRTVLNYFLQKELEREQDLPRSERDTPGG